MVLAAVALLALAGGAVLYLYLSHGDGGATGRSSASGAPPRESGSDRAVSAPTPAPPAGEPPGAEAPPAEGALRVLVTAGGRPVEGAEVRLDRRVPGWRGAGGGPWEPAGTGATDREGILSLPAAPGAYLVSASARGMAMAWVRVTRPAGEAVTRAELALAAGASLSGRTVERRRGDPVPLATVVLTPAEGPGRLRRVTLPDELRTFTTSDERGDFRVSSLTPGRYDVEARAAGHATAFRRDVTVPSSAPLRLELAAAGTIEGVVSRGGRPVSGAEVVALGTGEPSSAQSGDRGAFALEVEPGVHRLVARVGGESGAPAHPVEVAAGAVVRGVEIRLSTGPVIAGQIRSSAGPVAGAAVVAAVQGDAAGARSALAGDDGSYEIAGLVPGAYTVSATAEGFAPATVAGIHLRVGDRFRLDLGLSRPTALAGTVTDGSGAPVSGALVTSTGPWPTGGGMGRARGPGREGPASLAAVTDLSGRFRIEGMEPGRLRLSARKDAGWASTVVEVGEGETGRADLTLVEGGMVSGVVRDSSGSPVPSVTVAALLDGRPARPGESDVATTDAAGGYRLALAPGAYGLAALRPTGTFRRGRPPVLAKVTVTVGQPVQADLVLPDEPAATLWGHVVEPGGAPSAGAFVWAGTLGPGMQATQADAEGAFGLSPAAGTEVSIAARNGGRAVSASATPPASDMVLVLQPGATLHGDLAGDPAPESFTVTLGGQGIGAGPGPGAHQFAGASFDLDDVLPGAVSVHVRTGDGRVGDAEVSLASGGSANVAVPLSPAATIAGRLVDATTGQPVPRARVLVDGNASRRGVGADGRFTRVVSVGAHEVTVLATGYARSSLSVNAGPQGVDLGDLKLQPGPPAATP